MNPLKETVTNPSFVTSPESGLGAMFRPGGDRLIPERPVRSRVSPPTFHTADLPSAEALVPVLNLPDFHNMEASVYLLAVMFNPSGTGNDHQRFLDAVRNQAVFNVLRKEPDMRPVTREGIDAVTRAVAGPQLIDFVRGQMPSQLSRGGVVRPMMAGRLLWIVLTYAEHDPANVSKEKAYTMIREACGKARIPDSSRLSLMKSFDDFQGVAHLWAATVITGDLWRNLTTAPEIAYFLGISEVLRRKAEVVRLDQGMLLDPAKTWTVSDRFVLPAPEIPLPTPAMLKAAMSHWPVLSKSL